MFPWLEDLLDPAKTLGERASYRLKSQASAAFPFAVDDGRVERRASSDPADCVLRMSKETFIRINTGEDNPMTTFLRGELAFEGDLFLVSKLDRYARGPTGEITDAMRRRSS